MGLDEELIHSHSVLATVDGYRLLSILSDQLARLVKFVYLRHCSTNQKRTKQTDQGSNRPTAFVFR